MNDFIWLSLFWIGFYFLHSLLAANLVKAKLAKLIGDNQKYYRLFYNLLNAVLLFFILTFQVQIVSEKWFDFGRIQFFVATLFLLIGSYVLVQSFRSFNKAEFLGIEQIQNTNKAQNAPVLITTGWYAYVRHPLYFGMILVLLGVGLLLLNLSTTIMVLISFGYLIIGTKLEEQKLVEAFGSKYKQYQLKVKMLIPFLY